MPLQKPLTQAAQFEESYLAPRLFSRLALGFGLLAAFLVATGIYGTLAYRVQRRTGEIGVRMAVGATRAIVLGMVLRESLWIALAGFAVGLPLCFAVSRLLRTQVYGFNALDPASFLVAMAVTGFRRSRRSASACKKSGFRKPDGGAAGGVSGCRCAERMHVSGRTSSEQSNLFNALKRTRAKVAAPQIPSRRPGAPYLARFSRDVGFHRSLTAKCIG